MSPLARPAFPLGGIGLSRIGVAAMLAALVLVYAGLEPVRAEVARLVAVLAGGNSEAIRDYLRSFGPWAPAVSVGMMLAQAIVSPIPQFLVVFANGLAFGLVGGWVLSMLGQVVAAAACFWIARVVGRGTAEKLAGRFGLAVANRWFARWGTAGVLAARLVPGVGFDAVSLAAGVSGMRFGGFLVATLVGSAPQALLYTFLGERAPQLAGWLLAASVGAGLIAAAVAVLRLRLR